MKLKSKVLISVLIAFCTLISSIALGLGIIHLTGFIYDIDLEALDIPENSGYSKETCLENYDYVMEYLAPFNSSEFELPSMEYSNTGSVHFEDCRTVFNTIYLLGLVGLLVIILVFVFLKIDKFVFKLSGVLTLGLPLFTALAMAVNFDWAFTFFHKLVFNDQNWLFHPDYDPIITILPEEFFMHCGIFIALIVILSSAGLFIKGCIKK